jgi:hypothetical protein
VRERLQTTAPTTHTIEFVVKPEPLSASVLQERLGVSRADADAMMRAARTGAFVDEKDYVRNNPRQSAVVPTLTVRIHTAFLCARIPSCVCRLLRRVRTLSKCRCVTH